MGWHWALWKPCQQSRWEFCSITTSSFNFYLNLVIITHLPQERKNHHFKQRYPKFCILLWINRNQDVLAALSFTKQTNWTFPPPIKHKLIWNCSFYHSGCWKGHNSDHFSIFSLLLQADIPQGNSVCFYINKTPKFIIHLVQISGKYNLRYINCPKVTEVRDDLWKNNQNPAHSVQEQNHNLPSYSMGKSSIFLSLIQVAAF